MDIGSIDETSRLMSEYKYFRWLNSAIDEKRDHLIDSMDRMVHDIVDIDFEQWYLDSYEL